MSNEVEIFDCSQLYKINIKKEFAVVQICGVAANKDTAIEIAIIEDNDKTYRSTAYYLTKPFTNPKYPQIRMCYVDQVYAEYLREKEK